MEREIIEYGTKVNVKVMTASKSLISVVGDNGQGYLLLGHGIKDLPKIGELGQITFVKSNTQFKGHWHYESDNSTTQL